MTGGNKGPTDADENSIEDKMRGSKQPQGHHADMKARDG
jgi:hypothetical protein